MNGKGHYHHTRRERDDCPVCHPKIAHKRGCIAYAFLSGKSVPACVCNHHRNPCPDCHPCHCGEPEARVPNSHLTWCRLLVIAYGKMETADEALDALPNGWEAQGTPTGVATGVVGHYILIRPERWVPSPSRDTTLHARGGGLVGHQRHPVLHDRNGVRACDWVRRWLPVEYAQKRDAWAQERLPAIPSLYQIRKLGRAEYPVKREDVIWNWVYRRPSCEACQVLEEAAQEHRASLRTKKFEVELAEERARGLRQRDTSYNQLPLLR